MDKKILLIGYNFKPEITGIGKYSGEMMDWMAKEGHSCYVLTGYPYYPQWKVETPNYFQKYWYKKEIEKFSSGGSLKVYRCPLYVPRKPTALRRILLDCSFFVSAFFISIYLLLTKKFDYVVTVAPAFHVGLLGILFKNLHNSHFQYHIQDLQIEAARDMCMIKSKTLVRALFSIENFILQNVDSISTISKGMKKKIKKKFDHKVKVLPNWVDVDFFHPTLDKNELKSTFGFRALDKIILYSGSIGEKQGLEMILESANKMKKIDYIQFVICGTGPSLENLKKIKISQDLKNVHFFSLQPLHVFNSFLNMADVHLVLQKSSASDLVMPSKLATILAVGGLAIVTAPKKSALYKIIDHNNIGILINPDDQHALDMAISSSVSDDFSEIAVNARKYACGKLSIDAVLGHYFFPYLNKDPLTPLHMFNPNTLKEVNQ
jgi:colanic acid biosynthesis glycosyl transferase WcaI